MESTGYDNIDDNGIYTYAGCKLRARYAKFRTAVLPSYISALTLIRFLKSMD